jgi:formylglycine-generating enzyme required for sulfatase activity
MVRQLIKKDKTAWAYIPMSTEVLNGQKISSNAFYISTMEVTNNQYRVFLNDLLIKDKTDDYIKAVPDTTKWRIENRPFYDPMVKYYFWHPAYNDFPVLNISREGAKMYCDWLTNAVNEKIKTDNSPEKVESLYINDLRIPNEIEWVTAARGKLGDVDYPWTISPDRNSVQNMIGCYLCNFSIINYPDSLKKKSECSKLPDAITSAGSISGEFYFTAKSNSYNPNNYGLFCISGNAAEMVWQNETLKPITKGGSWNSDADHVKINSTENEDVTEGSPYIGFRPVFTASPKKR